MANSNSAASNLVPDSTPVYYVVPVIVGGDVREPVIFFEVADNNEWTIIPPKELNALSQGGNSDQVKLVQPSWEVIMANTGLPPEILDQNARLYAAVARTVSGQQFLPSVYAVGINLSLTIDVAPGTTRALILAFTRTVTDTGLGAAADNELTSTNEPEIKNGVGCPD